MKITLNDIEEKFIPVRPGTIVAQSRRLLGQSVTNSSTTQAVLFIPKVTINHFSPITFKLFLELLMLKCNFEIRKARF